MKLLTAIRAIASKALGLNIPRQQTRSVSQETTQKSLKRKPEEPISEATQTEVIEARPVAKTEVVIPQDDSDGGAERTWEQASNELKASGRPGKVIREGDSFYVEYHDHWLDEHEEKKKAKEEERLLQIQLAKEEEERRNEKIRLDRIRVKKQKEEDEKRQLQEEEERKIQLQKEHEDRLRRERKSAEKLAAWELKKSISQKEAKQALVRDLLGKDVTILAQYRHPAARLDQLSIWGAWVIVSNGNYSIYHESEGRVTYGNRESVVEVNSRQEAIDYCDFLVSKQWYRDTRLFEADPSTHDFPHPPMPTEEESDEARRKFRSWREIAMQEEESD